MQALEKDTLGLFSEDTSLSNLDNTIISDAFKRKCRIVQKRDAQGNDVMEELAVLKIRGTDIKQSEFLRLRDGVWLNDTLIYCFLKKYVQDEIDQVYCFGTHFFTRLIELDGEYNYDRVKNWGRRFPKANPITGNPGGLAGLTTLYVPINIGNQHWIFLKVDVQGKKIELYDSWGYVNTNNAKYLWNMVRYVYDELHKNMAEEERPNFHRWRRGWKAIDKSLRSPNQLNTHDCGLFVMLTIYLNSRGASINRLMYDQHAVDTQKLRRKIATLFIRDNEMGTLPALSFSRAVGRSSRKSRKLDKTNHDSTEEPKKSKRVKRGDSDAPQVKKGTRKRAAKSLSGQEQTQLTLYQKMFVPPKRKRKKENKSEICSGCKSS